MSFILPLSFINCNFTLPCVQNDRSIIEQQKQGTIVWNIKMKLAWYDDPTVLHNIDCIKLNQTK